MAKKGGKKEVLVIASKMKEAIRKHGCNVSSDVVDTLSAKIHDLIGEAAARCKSNGRKTVRGADF